jgi:hypothetical protein
MSSVELPCSRARVVCSRVTNWSGEGIEPKSLSTSVWFRSLCDGCPPLPFIDARGRGQKGNKRRVTMLGH